MSTNKVILAAAGSGKTTFLVKDALEKRNGNVLITTYTQANEAEIRKKIIEINKCIPKHITVQSWFSFLLKHGVRPFQPFIFEKKIRGLLLVNCQSGLKYTNKYGIPVYYKEDGEFECHYFTKDLKIYSDKLSKFVIKCNKKANGAVIERLTKIYSNIYVDEVQDLAGYDLEILKLFLNCPSELVLVGDPRQGTYSTNTTAKNKKFRKSEIIHFFHGNSDVLNIDESSLLINFRCMQDICDLSDNLFPEYKKTTSGNKNTTSHDGVFFIKETDINSYIEIFEPMQLRDSVKKAVNENFPVMNFGESKGLSFDRVLIYPTKPIIDWLLDNSKEFAPTSLSKFYVALTRARYSVGIVYNYNNKTAVQGITNYVSV